ncbi:MAG: hypothetical protein P8X95_18875 [Anaerolineales bacterium]|jgi:hypothetical protein
MNTWFTSRKGALTLSLIALLTLLARSYYDTRFILTEEFSPLAPGMDTWGIIGYTAIVGGNIAILLAATGNSRAAWIALLVYNLFTGLGMGAGSLVVYLSNTLELVIFTASLITGVPAALSVGFQLRRGRVASRITAG